MAEDDRRSRRAREAIDAAALSLMRERDFESISVSDIAKRADVNRATFYHHYVDKYDWLEQCIRNRLQEVVEVQRFIRFNSGPDDQFEKFIQIFQHFDKNFDFYSLMLHNEGTLFFQKRFKEIIRELVKEKASLAAASALEFDFLINYVASAFSGLVEWWIENNRPLPPETMAKNMNALLSHAPLKMDTCPPRTRG